MYLELLGDIVSILYCVYSSHSVLKSVLFFFPVSQISATLYSAEDRQYCRNPLDRWRALHYQGIFPHSNCSPLFIGSLVKIAEGK